MLEVNKYIFGLGDFEFITMGKENDCRCIR